MNTAVPPPTDREMLRWLWSRLMPWRPLLVAMYATSGLVALLTAVSTSAALRPV